FVLSCGPPPPPRPPFPTRRSSDLQIDRNPARPQLPGQTLGEGLQRRLGSGIDRQAAERDTFPDIAVDGDDAAAVGEVAQRRLCGDRKSTRMNSSHVKISYAVFCLK